MTSCLEAALAYASRGWFVFPVLGGGKHPNGQLCPQGHLNATTDPSVIRAWWAASPSSNVGISLAPSGLTVLDVDVRDGKPGKASLEALELEMPLPDTLVNRTGGGGLHAIYATVGEPAKRNNYRPAIDVLGKGYIVAPPSIHESGMRYEVLVDHPVVPMPPFWNGENRHPAIRPTPTEGERIKEPGRNVALASYAGRMRHAGFEQGEIEAALLELNAGRCDPPLDADEVRKIAWSVGRYASGEESPQFLIEFQQALLQIATRPASPAQDAPPTSLALAEPPSHPQSPPQGSLSVLVEDDAAHPYAPIVTYTTGLGELDALTSGGPATGHLWIITGPPGGGKTAAGTTLSLLLAQRRPVLYISTELETREITARFAGNLLDLPWIDVTDGRVTREQAVGALRGRPIHVVGCERLPRGMQALVAVAGEMGVLARRYGLAPIVVVDYLQDLARGGTEEGTRGRVSEVASLMRQMAQQAETAVIAVSSVARAYYKIKLEDDDPTAHLASGKESGDVEYAAACVIGTETGDWDEVTGSKPARWAIAKARRGRTGYVGMRFHGASGRWVPDGGALAEMSVAARADAKTSEHDAADDTAVLARLRELAGAPEPPTKRGIRAICGIRAQRADAAILRLLARGEVTATVEDYFDQLHRKQKREVLRLVDKMGILGFGATSWK